MLSFFQAHFEKPIQHICLQVIKDRSSDRGNRSTEKMSAIRRDPSGLAWIREDPNLLGGSFLVSVSQSLDPPPRPPPDPPLFLYPRDPLQL